PSLTLFMTDTWFTSPACSFCSWNGTSEHKRLFVEAAVRIYHADCRDLRRRLPTESVDMVHTDPPYLMDYHGPWGSDWEPITGDGQASWLLPAFAETWRAFKPNSLCLSFYGWPHADLFLSISSSDFDRSAT